MERFDLNKTYQYLLITLAFLMPLTVVGANAIIIIIVFLWLCSGDYKSKYNDIISSKLMIASIVFYIIHIIGMFWTEDLEWGFHILHKMWYFLLLLPVLYNIVNKEYTKYYMYAFLVAIALTEVLSYLIWFEVVEPFMHAETNNPTPTMSHISYNPFLVFAIYLAAYEVFINKKLSKLMLWLYSSFLVILVINMFITGGRAGQIMFFAMMVILIFQYFKGKRIKALIAVSILLPGVFLTAYHTSDIFSQRVDVAIDEFVEYELNYGKEVPHDVRWRWRQTSIGVRILFTINSWDLFIENPLLGVGTGDFPNEYKKINEFNSSEALVTTNPHNMYILVLAQLGIVGLWSMLSIFYYQIKLSFSGPSRFIRDFRIALPLLFLVIMWSDSYLLGHFTGLLFVFFSSFLYKDFEKS